MQYFIKLMKTLNEIIIYIIIEPIIMLVGSFIYILSLNSNDSNYLKLMLENFIIKDLAIITIIINVILILILLKKNYSKESKVKLNNYLLLAVMGAVFAILLNYLFILLFGPNQRNDIPFYIVIIGTAIVGPIIEEILFRKILYNRLKEFNSKPKANLITTLIFALIHINPIKIGYAFIMGLLFNHIYEQYHNIKASMIFHMSANLFVIFIFKINYYLLTCSVLILIIWFIYYKPKMRLKTK